MKRNGSGMAGNTSFVAGVLLLTLMCATAHAAGTWTPTGSGPDCGLTISD